MDKGDPLLISTQCYKTCFISYDSFSIDLLTGTQNRSASLRWRLVAAAAARRWACSVARTDAAHDNLARSASLAIAADITRT